MQLNDLIALVPPPLAPKHSGPISVISAIESSIGLKLPGDIYRFAQAYGSGTFGTTLTVYNPFSPQYKPRIDKILHVYRNMKRSEGDEYFPYPLHPEPGGVYPWAGDVNGHSLWWMTDGLPEKWSVLAMTDDAEFQELELSFIDVLVNAFRADIDCILWDREWLSENFVNIQFIPEK